MIPRRCIELALISIGLCAAAPARAGGPEVEMLSDTDLSRQRGGFSWQGLDIRFGAEIHSYLNGELVMRTTVTWTDAGSDVRRIRPTSSVPLPAELATALATSGPQSGMADGDTLIVDRGQTAFVQRTDGAVQSIIVNRASNVDLRQQLDITLDIGGYAQMQAAAFTARIGSALAGLSEVGVARGRVN